MTIANCQMLVRIGTTAGSDLHRGRLTDVTPVLLKFPAENADPAQSAVLKREYLLLQSLNVAGLPNRSRSSPSAVARCRSWKVRQLDARMPRVREPSGLRAATSPSNAAQLDGVAMFEAGESEGVGFVLDLSERKRAVSNVVGYIKGNSAIKIARKFGGRQRNFTGEHFWARGYFVSTVGLDEQMARAYIRNQDEEDERYDQMKLAME